MGSRRQQKNRSQSTGERMHGIPYRRWSLGFLDKNLEQRFAEHHFHQNWRHLRVALLISVLVFILVTLLDYVLLEEVPYSALGVRILSYVPLVIVLMLLSYTKHWRLMFVASPFAVVIAGLSLVMPLSQFSLYSDTLYFVAMLLFMLFAYGVMRARFLWVVRAGLLLTLGYQLNLLFLSPVETDIFVGRTLMLIAANIIGVFSAYTVEHFARRDFIQTSLMANSADSLALNISHRDQHLREFILASRDIVLFQLRANIDTGKVVVMEHSPALTSWLGASEAKNAPLSAWFGNALEQDSLVSRITQAALTGEQDELSFSVAVPGTDPRRYKLLVVGSDSVYDKHRSVLGILVDQTEEERARQKQQELLTQKTKFLDITGHQLSTPLSVMRWGLEELVGTTASLPKEELVGGMQHAVDRMTRTLHDVFIALSVADKDPELTITRFTVGELLETIPSYYREDKRLSVRISNRLKKEVLEADQQKFLFIIERILENAFDYSDREITCAVEQRASSLLLSITDHGFGVLPSERPYIFQLFYRGQKAIITKPNKSGMSLYLVRKYIQAHGGGIRLDASSVDATTFIFDLPVIASQEK